MNRPASAVLFVSVVKCRQVLLCQMDPAMLGAYVTITGNIRKSKDVWVGQTGNDGAFVTFATPAHGIRATGRNLLSYARQGYVTPEQIITRWAPPEDDNDTEGYIKFVSEYLNVPRDTRLDLTDLNTLTRLSMAIMIKENGQSEFDKIAGDDISNGIQAALGLVDLPQSGQVPKRLTGSAAFDALDQSDRAKYLRQAEQMDKQRQQKHRKNSVPEWLMPMLRGKTDWMHQMHRQRVKSWQPLATIKAPDAD